MANPNWKSGVSGNPSGLPGRPLGAKHKLAGAFLTDIYAEWQRSGKTALERMAKDDPGKFVQVVSALMPKETALDISVAVENRFKEMSYSELLALGEAFDAATKPLQIEDSADEEKPS